MNYSFIQNYNVKALVQYEENGISHARSLRYKQIQHLVYNGATLTKLRAMGHGVIEGDALRVLVDWIHENNHGQYPEWSWWMFCDTLSFLRGEPRTENNECAALSYYRYCDDGSVLF